MPILSLVGAAVSFVVILILAFQNLQAACNYLTFFFWELSSSISPTFILFGASFLGMIFGVFATLFLMGMLNKSEDEEGDENFNA